MPYRCIVLLNMIGKYKIVVHVREEYVREENSHINGLEGLWSYAKTWLYHYRKVLKQYYFHLCLKKMVEFRFHNRDKNFFHMFTNILLKLFQN